MGLKQLSKEDVILKTIDKVAMKSFEKIRKSCNGSEEETPATLYMPRIFKASFQCHTGRTSRTNN
jgi:hypothetical protein